MMGASLIGLDWGSTAVRAYLIGPDGAALQTITGEAGILNVPEQGFEAEFERLLTPWLGDHGALPILASGMITSRSGWVETPYLPAPAGAEAFAAALRPYQTARGRRLHFVTGLTVENEAGAPDVLRGEETEIIGHMSRAAVEQGIYLVPGTHSKWATIEGGQLIRFQTFMTGEIFAALRAHTILARLTAEGPFSLTGFDAGAQAGLETGSALLHRLFAVRTLPLFDRLTPLEAHDYLSGLLIGSEIAAGLATRPGIARVFLIGQHALAARYERVLARMGIAVDRVEQSMVTHGHWRIATLAGLIS